MFFCLLMTACYFWFPPLCNPYHPVHTHWSQTLASTIPCLSCFQVTSQKVIPAPQRALKPRKQQASAAHVMGRLAMLQSHVLHQVTSDGPWSTRSIEAPHCFSIAHLSCLNHWVWYVFANAMMFFCLLMTACYFWFPPLCNPYHPVHTHWSQTLASTIPCLSCFQVTSQKVIPAPQRALKPRKQQASAAHVTCNATVHFFSYVQAYHQRALAYSYHGQPPHLLPKQLAPSHLWWPLLQKQHWSQKFAEYLISHGWLTGEGYGVCGLTTYIYICVYIYVCIYIYVYIYM